jgi:hypothetical protein
MSTKLGKYADSGKGNVLDRLVKKSDGDTYGGYEHFSIGRTVNQKPRPSVQDNGRETK